MKKLITKVLKESLGAASIKIEKENGMIQIYHGTDGDLLDSFKATDKSWDMIWKGIQQAKRESNMTGEFDMFN